MPSYVVTGANRGIGFEFIRQLSQDSSNIVIGLVRNKANSKDLLDLQSKSENIHVFQADIVDVPSLKDAVREVSKVNGGTLDYLINNAALISEDNMIQTPFGYYEGKEDLLEQDFLENYKVNVIGTMHVTNAFLPLIRAAATKSTAKVINLSSGIADLDLTLAAHIDSTAPYSASKAAQNIITAKYANEFSKENIIFLGISPGLVNTATKPPTPEQLEVFASTVGSLKKYAPEWDGNPITPETSVKMMFDVFASLKKEDSGTFVSHFGTKQWL